MGIRGRAEPERKEGREGALPKRGMGSGTAFPPRQRCLSRPQRIGCVLAMDPIMESGPSTLQSATTIPEDSLLMTEPIVFLQLRAWATANGAYIHPNLAFVPGPSVHNLLSSISHPSIPQTNMEHRHMQGRRSGLINRSFLAHFLSRLPQHSQSRDSTCFSNPLPSTPLIGASASSYAPFW